ncbi:MAG: TIGR01212 family radical SAM protein [Ruminococcaceae bacterium]|nr:TIGR01212 family radical SAM protein [Oscillospiraceae bacterium]
MTNKTKQKDTNPFKNTDSNKRYYTYDYFLRKTFGEKCAKITLDAGFTCPNIDGRCGYGGCIYCSSRGSGDFSQSAQMPLAEQYERQISVMKTKWQTNKFIPYLQAHTNTYANTDKLRDIYRQILNFPNAVGFNIATRADCLPNETVELLAEIAEKTYLTVELGLQSIFDDTARLINRGHTFEEFSDGFCRLRQASDKIKICVHLINGLPYEDSERMLESARVIGEMRPDQIKFHMLHVLKGTVLAQMYENGEYTPMEMEEYAEIICRQLEVIPDDIVIGRITGDGKSDDLLAPEWSKKKFVVINTIDKLMFSRNTWQGRLV